MLDNIRLDHNNIRDDKAKAFGQMVTGNHLNTHHIAIIGMGPRGTYSLERLVSILKNTPTSFNIVIHVIEPREFASGQIYYSSQPEYLKFNTVACQITAFPDETVMHCGPITKGLTLYEWAQSLNIQIDPNEYPSRAMHGRYLRYVYDTIKQNLPHFIKVKEHTALATDINSSKDNYYITLNNQECIKANKIILTTGHSFPKNYLLKKDARIRNFNNSNTKIIHNPYEHVQYLESLLNDTKIGIMGLGLSTVDIITMLISSKGGNYLRDSHGKLIYIPSGQEPKIIAWSRSGVPLSARAKNEKGIEGRYVAQFLTNEYIDAQRNKSKTGKLSFITHILPRIIYDMEYVYYTTLMGEEFGQEYKNCRNFKLPLINLLKKVPNGLIFDWKTLANPMRKKKFDSKVSFKKFLIDYIEYDITEARKGNVSGAFKSACDVLRDIRDNIRYATDFASLTAKSHMMLDKYFTPINNRLAVGPPLFRMEEMLALINAEVLDIFFGSAPELSFNQETNYVEIIDSFDNQTKEAIDILVNGVLPGTNVTLDDSVLMQNMLEKGMIRQFINQDNDFKYIPGGIDITPSNNIIDEKGKVNNDIYAIGVLTEGKILYTTVAARPKFNSRALSDAGKCALLVVKQLLEYEYEKGYQTSTSLNIMNT